MRRLRHLLWLLMLCPLAGCEEGELEVRGKLDRVIGETVTLNLVEGETEFSGKLSLVDAARTRFTSADLKLTKKSSRQLTFVVPPDAAAGKAAVEIGKQGETGAYNVPLQVNRLVLGLGTQGSLEVFPLPPTALKASSVSVGAASGAGQLSVSPRGGLVATLLGNQLSLFSLAAQPDKVAALAQTGQCLAALDDGVLVGTTTAVLLYTRGAGKSIKQQVSFTVPGCRDISVDAVGSKALVLSRCDTSKGGVPDADCLTEITLGTNLKEGAPVVLDKTPSATHVSLALDGKNAVVADGDTIYGVLLNDPNGTATAPHKVSKLSWAYAGATPVALSRASRKERISKKLVDLFAVAESSKKLVRFVGIDVDMVKWVELGDNRLEVQLPDAPTGLSFGRRLDLYVSAARKLYRVKALQSNPQLISLGGGFSSALSALGAQP